jgi:hypothetical protein
LALVKHLHGFVREVRLSEREFQEGEGFTQPRVFGGLNVSMTGAATAAFDDHGSTRGLRAHLRAMIDVDRWTVP